MTWIPCNLWLQKTDDRLHITKHAIYTIGGGFVYDFLVTSQQTQLITDKIDPIERVLGIRSREGFL